MNKKELSKLGKSTTAALHAKGGALFNIPEIHSPSDSEDEDHPDYDDAKKLMANMAIRPPDCFDNGQRIEYYSTTHYRFVS